MKRLLLSFLLLAQVYGCVKDNVPVIPSDVEYSRVRFNMALNGFQEVKSAFSADENYIEKLSVWAYDENTGLLDATKIFSASSVSKGELEMPVRRLGACTFFFLANCDATDAPMLLEDAAGYVCLTDKYVGFTRSFPMSAVVEHVDASADISLDVTLDRLVAKYYFLLDRSGLKGKLELVSVSVKQAAVDVSPFRQSRASVVSQGDYASDPDLKDIMGGMPAYFYILENCRGNLSEGNTSPWKKIPSDPDEAALATYIEVHARYESPTLESGDLTYRMYLGKDNLTNYDIQRNGAYTVTLSLSDLGITQGILNSQWKMDPGDYRLTGSLQFGKRAARCAACYEAPFIRRFDGSTVVEIADTVPVVRSSPRLSYSLSYDIACFAQAGLNVENASDRVIVRPGAWKTPEGTFDIGIYSYDILLSDTVKVYCGIMDLNVKFDHPSGEIVVWSANGNPTGAKLKIGMDYEVCASAWGGSSVFDMHTYYTRDAGSSEYVVIPSETPVSMDKGKLCAVIRNISDGIVPNPDGPERYLPYSINLNFRLAVIAPESCVGRTLVRFNSEIFNQPSAGYVNNNNYMGRWYLDYGGTGKLWYYRNTMDETELSQVSVSESCNGIIFNTSPNVYSSAVFEI